MGQFWLVGHVERRKQDPRVPNYSWCHDEYTLLRVSQDGRILDEILLHDLLFENGFSGLLNFDIVRNDQHVRCDILHLNDVDPFPADMEPGIFGPGDVLLSFRDVNSVLVLNWERRKIKFSATGLTHRQHDPDFIDGNSFSVFDNNAPSIAHEGALQSRIVKIEAPELRSTVLYAASHAEFFHTAKMGWHQRLPNGNLLLVESEGGRAFEVDANNEIVWQFVNQLEGDVLGLITQVRRYPANYAGSRYI